MRSVLLEELCRTCCCFPFLGTFFFGLSVATWPIVVTFSMACRRSSSDVFLDRLLRKYARPALASNLRRIFGRVAHLLQTLAPHQLQPHAVYPQQHIRTPHLAPVRKILARLLLLLLLLLTDDVGKQSPGERAFRHPSVRESRRQHGDGQLCKPDKTLESPC